MSGQFPGQRSLLSCRPVRLHHDLRGRAIAFGWSSEQIIVIDTGQGHSGASAADREGFQRLVADVGTGKAGIVLGLERSRLARNNADWHRHRVPGQRDDESQASFGAPGPAGHPAAPASIGLPGRLASTGRLRNSGGTIVAPGLPEPTGPPAIGCAHDRRRGVSEGGAGQ